ncbi:hypothetical protein E1301_Tti021506 [Triplophysa tibetana]|uniref:BEN domain-containing protein n=1 Tax=Triplophysa tibetana TaxID=1572043 RepID=A0A5A9NUX7_9TELE|nr:hypothetical protein E1301_Tti021506 [Triplophysa tibetana]
MKFILIQWIEDPPTWDVLPIDKIVNGRCEIGGICDVSYNEESSPAKILNIGTRSAMMKQLYCVERDSQARNRPQQDEEVGRGQRKKYRRILSDSESSEEFQVRIGPNTSITAEQYGHVKWTDAKKATKDLLISVFGRRILATHCYTGKCSNAFKNKDAKPQLDPEKASDIISYIKSKFNIEVSVIKKAISEKCSDECKLSKRRNCV